jgi:hypothetical protein
MATSLGLTMQGSNYSVLFHTAIKVFKLALKDYLLSHSFCSVEDFTPIENN